MAKKTGQAPGRRRELGGQLRGAQGPDALWLLGKRGQGVVPAAPGTGAALRGAGLNSAPPGAASALRDSVPRPGSPDCCGRAPAGRARGQAPRSGEGCGVRLPSRGGGCSRSPPYNAGTALPSATHRSGCGNSQRAASPPPLRPGAAQGLGKRGKSIRRRGRTRRRAVSIPPLRPSRQRRRASSGAGAGRGRAARGPRGTGGSQRRRSAPRPAPQPCSGPAGLVGGRSRCCRHRPRPRRLPRDGPAGAGALAAGGGGTRAR